MKGELGIKIKEIRITKFREHNHDLTFYDEDGGFFHICGDNDIEKLLIESLRNFKSEFKGELIGESEVLKRYSNPIKMHLDLLFKDPCYFTTKIQGVTMNVSQAINYLENMYNIELE